MSSSDEIGKADRTRSDKPALSSEHRDLVDQLAELWLSRTGWDRLGRDKLGGILNAALGPPTEPSPVARRVVRALAERMGVTAADLGRMRRSVHRFGRLCAEVRATQSPVTARPRPEDFPRLLVIEGE